MPLKKEFFINFLFAIIPISFIAGNLLINLNILLILFFSLFFFKLKIFEETLSNIDKLIIIFFLYVSINGITNDYLNYNDSNNILIKSLSYLRFILLYFIIKFLIRKNIISFKYLFFSFGMICLFVVLDIIIQYTFGRDIFGYSTVPEQRVFSGPFGDEYVAGSFIQRFYIFALYFILLFSKFKKNYFLNISIYISIAFFLLGVVLAGNRIPFVMLISTLVLFLIFEKIFRKKSLVIILVSILIISVPITLNKNTYTHYLNFVKKSVEIKDYLLVRLNFLSSKQLDHLPNTYTKEIETGILVWQQNKLTGGGVKSFYFNCEKITNSIMEKSGGTNCNTHPHNYYLHIATELGLVGLFLIITIFFVIIRESLKTIFFKKNNDIKKLLVPFFIVFIAEIFPIKTTGSFFTTANSTFLFIIIAFIVGLIQLKKRGSYD
tara:strand:+ start:2700 stop:4004 length:1305 start_codon:yes stop_codon:yes gene_type:complete